MFLVGEVPMWGIQAVCRVSPPEESRDPPLPLPFLSSKFEFEKPQQ
jgi:hypothetical protein